MSLLGQNSGDKVLSFDYDDLTDITESLSDNKEQEIKGNHDIKPEENPDNKIKEKGEVKNLSEALTGFAQQIIKPVLKSPVDSVAVSAPSTIPMEKLDFEKPLGQKEINMHEMLSGDTLDSGDMPDMGDPQDDDDLSQGEPDGGTLGGLRTDPHLSSDGGLPQQPIQLPQMTSSSQGDDDDDDDDDEDGQNPLPEGSYDPAEYEDLDVNAELKELFTYITRYTPQTIELEHRLRPYIPDYIPAVGDIDAFIKINPPDGSEATLGLTVLDEPSARQSDSTVLDLQLRAVAKHKTARAVVVKTVEHGEKASKVIDKWIRDISDLHRAKPPPTVHYAKRMPDIDSLMQEWPEDVEQLLKEINLPSGALQLELPQYVDIICSLLDIPVYKSRIQSLHVLFTLYSVFKNSAHFRHFSEDDSSLLDDHDPLKADRLVIDP